MEVDFLESAHGIPLTKRFVKTSEGIEVEPFPNVRNVISHRESITTLRQFYDSICRHAQQQHCLLKGVLDQQLNNESRAGHTDSTTPTYWLLLDLDFNDGWESVDSFIFDLNPEWAEVSYIWQHSSSAGIKNEPGLRGHLWIMLNEPMSPQTAKAWLKERNLNLSKLRERIELAANGQSAKFPLDITTCQNDKLIYIATPQIVDMKDPLNQRIQLVEKTEQFAPAPKVDVQSATIEHQTQQVVDELRRAADLPRRKAKYQAQGDFNLLVNPDQARVTGMYRARGFVRLNLDGGDSWGYYFPEDNPEFLYNFKGEPIVRLRDIAPEFYYDYRRAWTREQFGHIKPVVFRDPVTDTYYNLLYQQDYDRIEMMHKVAAKDRMKDFMVQYGSVMPDHIEDWALEFNPTTTEVFDEAGRWVNQFRPTEYIIYGPQLSAVQQIPPVIDKVLNSLTADDEETKEHFLNWLACLLQTRRHLGTAWVFHGVEGTGKGLLFTKVLRPILGEDHATEWTLKDFEDSFNTKLEHTCLLMLDEFKLKGGKNPDLLRQRLWNLITEDTLPIRHMQVATVERPNYVNVIVTSNSPDPLPISDNDRRFNIAPAQERPLRVTTKEVDKLDDERWMFVSYLMNRTADLEQAREVLENEAREAMQEASQTSQEAFFRAVVKGDLDYFASFLLHSPPHDHILEYQNFEKIVLSWIREYLNDPATAIRVLRDDLNAVFKYLTGIHQSPGKFSSMAQNYRCPMTRFRINGQRYQGRHIEFSTDDSQSLRRFLAMKNDSQFTTIEGGKE